MKDKRTKYKKKKKETFCTIRIKMETESNE